jgi:hypothetical protein
MTEELDTTVVCVGQVWKNKVNGLEATVVRVNGQRVYVDYTDAQGNSLKGVSFGSVNEEGRPTFGWGGWFCKTGGQATHRLTEQNGKAKVDEVMRFFASVAEGNCPCDMPRQQCDYHR